MSKRTSKSDKGCVGFVADGVMRKVTIYVFKTYDKDPSERIAELQEYFGAVKGKYINVANVDEIYDKFIEELSAHRIKETPLISVSITSGNDALKKVSDVKQSHNIKTVDKSEDNADNDAEEEEPEPEEKPKKTKSQAKTKATKKVESESLKSDNEENSDAGDGDDGSDDEDKNSKPKLCKKQTKASTTEKQEEDKPKKKGKSK
jgi:hypothetical protein